MKRITVIGSGFSGLSAAAYLAKAGHEVHVFEKNAGPGGRARQLTTPQGYVFDMGPSWYWMPEVYERFFRDFGYESSDFYELRQLNPAFEMVFDQHEVMRVPKDFDDLLALFERIETGSAGKLERFMADAALKYQISMDKFIYQPNLSIKEYLSLELMRQSVDLSLLSSFSKHVRKYFSNPKLLALMEFPVLFLGAMPENTPAMYSLMNYAGLKLGTWYPMGGFGQVVDAFVEVAEKAGVNFHFNSPVEEILVHGTRAYGLKINGQRFDCDGVIASADYHHVEQHLLPEKYRNYSTAYWEKRTLAPSSLIFYLGLNKKLDRLAHHTLFFDESLEQHSKDIYSSPAWPEKPLFYVSCTSKTDPATAPPGHENLFVLIPIAAGLPDDKQTRARYFEQIIRRLEKYTGESISAHIDFTQSYCVTDFMNDYHSYKGNAYGLANTLRQTGPFKPKVINAKIRNLHYAGQLTIPGPGVPPAIISGKISANLMINHLKPERHEIAI